MSVRERISNCTRSKNSKILNDPCVQDDRTRASYTQTGLWKCCAVWSKRAFNSEASNGAKFGGSSNDATATLRPSARHAPLPRYASLAAGPMANQLQDSSVEDLLFYRALHDLAPAYIVDVISPYIADSNLLTVPWWFDSTSAVSKLGQFRLSHFARVFRKRH